MEEMKDYLPGRYRHFKGNEYELLCLAKHSETREDMVVYRALYGERGIWVRPACMWNEIIERDGKRMRRFTYIGESSAAAGGDWPRAASKRSYPSDNVHENTGNIDKF